MSKLLINEPPLEVLPTLAKLFGLNEAIVLQQIHYWLGKPKIGITRDDCRWVRNSMTEWQDNFPFWTTAVIRRTLKNLSKDGVLLIRDDLNKMGYDRTRWYSIDYDALAKQELLGEPTSRLQKVNKKRKSAANKRSTPLQNVTGSTPLQNVTPQVTKCNQQNNKLLPTIPETTPQTTSETTYIAHTREEIPVQPTSNGMTKNGYVHPDPEPIADLKVALTNAVKTPLWEKTEDDYDSAAYFLFGNDATPKLVAGFGEWWKVNGYYAGKPALKSLLDEWGNYVDGIQLGSGSDQNEGTSAWNEVKQFLFNGKTPDDFSDPRTLPALRIVTESYLRSMSAKTLQIEGRSRFLDAFESVSIKDTAK